MNKHDRKAAKPREIVECVAEYLKQGDLDGIITMFHPECKICFPADETAKHGKAGARDVFSDMVKQKPTLIASVSGEVTNGDTAILQGEWRIEDAKGQVMSGGTSTEVAKWHNGGWVYYIDCPINVPVPN